MVRIVALFSEHKTSNVCESLKNHSFSGVRILNILKYAFFIQRGNFMLSVNSIIVDCFTYLSKVVCMYISKTLVVAQLKSPSL